MIYLQAVKLLRMQIIIDQFGGRKHWRAYSIILVQYSIDNNYSMQKNSWQRAAYGKPCIQPKARWGHSAVYIGEEMVIFGGYADSTYMNDTWTFDTKHMVWSECITTGDIPPPRSNCSIHFNQDSKQLILFGGGGPNKLRYNDVHVLDWGSKEWRQVRPVMSQKMPWERTYHTSELLYPYLFVFGGQGIADLDDFWVFNFLSNKWTEINVSQPHKQRPCARRFHSSVIIGNTFYVIAGCHDKYRCLCDVFSIDLTSFISHSDAGQLLWKQVKVKNSSFLTRWGHTSAVFYDKVYIFGGRFSSDLQDILVFDPVKQTVKSMKVRGQAPKPRRRHSSIFVGSSMLIFGGFNGQYFNDLNYISIFDIASKCQLPNETKANRYPLWLDNKSLADCTIKRKDCNTFHVHKSLLVDKFMQVREVDEFLDYLDGRYEENQLLQIFQILYSGIGRMRQQYKLQHFKMKLFDTQIEKDSSFRKYINTELLEPQSLLPKSKITSRVITIEPSHYQEYLQSCRQNKYSDYFIIFNLDYFIPVNSAVLAINSLYFEYLFKSQRKDKQISINLSESQCDIRVFQVVLSYLQTGYLVVPKDIDENCWIVLYRTAHYFCLERLAKMCQMELINKIREETCEYLLDFSLSNHLDTLSLYCAEFICRTFMGEGKAIFKKNSSENQVNNNKLINHYNCLFQFDLFQSRLKKKQQQNSQKGWTPKNKQKENCEGLLN